MATVAVPILLLWALVTQRVGMHVTDKIQVVTSNRDARKMLKIEEIGRAISYVACFGCMLYVALLVYVSAAACKAGSAPWHLQLIASQQALAANHSCEIAYLE